MSRTSFCLFTLFSLVGCDFLEDATMTLNAEPEIPVFNGTLNDAMVQAKGQEEKDARMTLSGWWEAQSNQFAGWEGSVVGLDWCDGYVSDFETPTCVKLTVKVERDGQEIQLVQNFIPDTAVTGLSSPLREHITTKNKQGIDLYSDIWTEYLDAHQHQLRQGQCILVDGKVLSGVTSIADPNFYVHFEKFTKCNNKNFSPKTSTAKYNTDLGQQLAFTSLAFKHHGDMGALLAEYQSIFRGWNGRFNNWRGYFVEVDVDGGWVFDGDISVKTAFGKRDHRVEFQHPYSDLNEATLKLNGVRDMEPEDQMLVDLLQQPLSSKDCANISGKLLQPIQNIAGSSPLFYVNFDSISSCDPKPKNVSSQDKFVSHMKYIQDGGLSQGSNGTLEDTLEESIDQYLIKFAKQYPILKNWQGDVISVEGDSHEAEVIIEAGCSDCNSYKLPVKLKWYIHGDKKSEIYLKLKPGDCLTVNGQLETDRWHRDIDDLKFYVEPTDLISCGSDEAAAQAAERSQQLEKMGEEATVGAVAVGAGMSGAVGEALMIAEAGGTLMTTGTVVAIEPVGIVAVEGGYSLVMGEVLYETSTIAEVLFPPAALIVAGAIGYKMLSDHIEHEREVKEAGYRRLNEEAAQEFLAYATHVCNSKEMNTQCFREAFRQIATFTASSDVRINTLLGKLPADTSVKQKWVLQWENEFPKDDSPSWSKGFWDMDVVLSRIPSLTDKEKEQCRPKVDLIHLMMSERVIEELWHGRTSDVSGTDIIGMSESLYLGRKCLDLFLIEQHYLDASGLIFVWKEAFIKHYGSTEQAKQAAVGWSDGQYAQVCQQQESERSGLFFHVDCDVRAFGGELHCVCNGDDTPVSKALDKQDDKAYEMKYDGYFPEQKAYAKKRRADRQKHEAEEERKKRAEQKKKEQEDKLEYERLLKAEQEASQ